MNDVEITIIKIVFLILYFILLYFIAFISNKHYRDREDILFISKRQWKAIMVMCLPSILAILK